MTSGPPAGGVPPTGGWGGPPPGPPGPPQGPPGPPPVQAWQPPPGNRRNPLVVIGGILLGLALGFLVMPWLGIWLGSGAASTTDGSSESLGTIGVILGFGLPIVLGLGMLLSGRLRKAGAGVLMGISIGMIVGSASCLGVWGLFIAALSGAHG